MPGSGIRNIVVGCISGVLLLAAALPGLSAAGEKDAALRVAYQDRVGDASAVITAGMLEDSGAFAFERFSSGSMTAEALITGNADIATMGDAVAVSLASRYPDIITVIGIHGGGEGRHKLVRNDSTVETVGVKFGTSTHAALLAWLEEHPERAAVRLIDLSPSLQLSALAAGEIDALAASEPTPSVALRTIAGTTAISLAVAGRHYPLAAAVSRRALEEKGELIDQYIAALTEAAETVKASDGETLQLLSEVTGLDMPLLRASLAAHFFGWYPVEDFIDELDTLAAFLLALGRIDRMPVWD